MEPPLSILGFGYLHLFRELFLSWSTKVNNKDCLSTYNSSGKAATIRTKDTCSGYFVMKSQVIQFYYKKGREINGITSRA